LADKPVEGSAVTVASGGVLVVREPRG
jgi:hypothetical protein